MNTGDLPDVAKAAGELEPALAELARLTGADLPAREISNIATRTIYYRGQVRAARQIMRAVEKVRATGIPPHAVSDRTIRAILEDGGVEEDLDMQERWSNLLANEASGLRTPPAYLRILNELEPVEAQILDQLTKNGARDIYNSSADALGFSAAQFENMLRLGLLRLVDEADDVIDGGSSTSVFSSDGLTTKIYVTPLAVAIVRACHEPAAPQASPRRGPPSA